MSSNKYKFLFEVEFYNWDILFSELYSKVKKKGEKNTTNGVGNNLRVNSKSTEFVSVWL